MVEDNFGKLVQEKLAEKHPDYATQKDEILTREEIQHIAMLFMDDAIRKVYGSMMRKLADDFALDKDAKYPENLDEAYQASPAPIQ